MTKDAMQLGTEIHQAFERSYWGDCCNTYDEETKQYDYASHMGLVRQRDSFDLQGKNVLDIGGGPCSLLLKCLSLGPLCCVVDPCEYPDWTHERYRAHGIGLIQDRGEDLPQDMRYDEVWVYNVLQHVDSPSELLTRAWRVVRPGGVFRFFEWINIPPHEGHPHMITPETLLDSVPIGDAIREIFTGELFGPRMVGQYFSGCMTKVREE